MLAIVLVVSLFAVAAAPVVCAVIKNDDTIVNPEL